MMQSLGRPASADRSCGSRRVDASCARVDRSNTTSDLGEKRFFLIQMTRAKRAGTWFRLCRREEEKRMILGENATRLLRIG
jgi:hypothetical protein